MMIKQPRIAMLSERFKNETKSKLVIKQYRTIPVAMQDLNSQTIAKQREEIANLEKELEKKGKTIKSKNRLIGNLRAEREMYLGIIHFKTAKIKEFSKPKPKVEPVLSQNNKCRIM